MTSPLREKAKGRWRSILPAFGIGRDHLTGRHGPCPICRAGNDRFRFDNREGYGTWFCSHCGSGEGAALVMKVKGWDFRTAAKEIEREIGTAPIEKADPGPRPASPALIRRLWVDARPISAGDPVDRYLRRRLGIGRVFQCQELRFHPDLIYRDETVSRHPAMLALVRDPSGSPATLHRTFLTPEGEKAPVPDPRRIMPGEIPKGSAVRLMPHHGTIGIAEGIETAIAAASLHGVPCWSALNAGMLEDWEPPDGVREVIVFGDNDDNFVGQAAAYALAKRIARTKTIQVSVKIPDQSGFDWLDVLIPPATFRQAA